MVIIPRKVKQAVNHQSCYLLGNRDAQFLRLTARNINPDVDLAFDRVGRIRQVER